MKKRSSRHDSSLLDFLRLSLIAACILLVGCGPTFDELGFESEEEAQHLIEMGYPTFDALLTRGRFTSAEQAREAVEAGFYELSAYEDSQRQLALRESLTSPDWQPIDKMPKEWGRMQVQGYSCKFKGPEASVMFFYTDPEKGLWYYFQNLQHPSNVTLNVIRKVYVKEIKKVWVSSKNPDLYLAFWSDRGFNIHLIEDGVTAGQHETLDGEPWDLGSNLMAEYNAADYRRWAVDINNSEPYQKAPNQVCPPESYANWLDVRFEVAGVRTGTATLRQIMR